MTFLSTAKSYTQNEFTTMFNGLDFGNASWSPKMLVLHNTAKPTLAQWLAGPATPAERMKNLKNYYKDKLHWHSGPHWFVGPDSIWELCNPLEDGVHCSCANNVAFGCEMVGDYETEIFSSGDGAKVRDNAVHLAAVVFKKMHWQPIPLSLWNSGLAFHVDCAPDNHNCPGKNVVRADFIQRVQAKMATLI